MFQSDPPIPFPSPSAGSPGELAAGMVRAQMSVAGGLWRWSSDSVGFMTERVRKDAEFVSHLGNVRSPSEATTLVLRHMQSAWADYAAQAMKLGTMLTEDPETAADSASGTASPPQAEAPLPVAQPRVPAAPAKPARSEPV